MDFSIVIVTYNRKKYLDRCLNSIYSQKASDLKFETIVIFNGETSYLNFINKKYKECKTFYTQATTPSMARNIAISKCNGEYIFFLDDDCFLPLDYFQNMQESLATKNWDVLGGPDKTPDNASSFERALGDALYSPFCTGLTFKRHHNEDANVFSKATERDLILCNLWFKKSLFTNSNYSFPNDLFRNEENYLLKMLEIDHKKMAYNPSLFVYHNRKSDLNSLTRTIMRSGECRVQNYFKLPQLKELLYLGPLCFSIILILALFSHFSFYRYLIIGYLLCSITYNLIQHKKPTFFAIFLQFHILFFYSVGSLIGLNNELFLKFKSYLQSSFAK